MQTYGSITPGPASLTRYTNGADRVFFGPRQRPGTLTLKKVRMEEVSPAERKVQLVAGLAGLSVAGVVAIFVGVNAGLGAGLAVFFLSWTFVAIFVLVVRFAFRRFSPAPPAPPAPSSSTKTDSGGRPRRRRRRR